MTKKESPWFAILLLVGILFTVGYYTGLFVLALKITWELMLLPWFCPSMVVIAIALYLIGKHSGK